MALDIARCARTFLRKPGTIANSTVLAAEPALKAMEQVALAAELERCAA